jgi:hypothetical protein
VAAKLATLRRGDNQHSPIGETSQAQAGELLNVGKRSVERAKEVATTALLSLWRQWSTDRLASVPPLTSQHRLKNSSARSWRAANLGLFLRRQVLAKAVSGDGVCRGRSGEKLLGCSMSPADISGMRWRRVLSWKDWNKKAAGSDLAA